MLVALRALAGLFRTRGDVLPEVRATAFLVPPVLFAAFLLLYIFPDKNGDYFAWPVRPRLTAMMLGGTYFGGICYFYALYFSHHWRAMGNGFLPVTVFVSTLLVATILHWDRFNHDYVSFWLWLALYIITPVLVPFLWWRNSRHSLPLLSGPSEVGVPLVVRAAYGLCSVTIGAIGVMLFFAPGTMADAWPWTITPLTSRVLAAQFGLIGGFVFLIAREPRWEASRQILRSFLLLPLVYAGAVAASWNDLDTARPVTWLFLATASSFLVLGVPGMYFYMESRRQASRSRLADATRMGAPPVS